MTKTVVLGVTGCIAAYKACEVVRGLQQAGVRVKVLMTAAATEFVGPLTFRSLTREPVAVGLFDDAPGDPIHHISLAKEADLLLIAPCTANVLAKLAHGIADDLLTSTALATTAPILVAPAMNTNMYANLATQENMAKLTERGVGFVEPEEGYLACGDAGRGRLANPASIVESVLAALETHRDMVGKHVLITAGPTVEPIDSARFISNHSSGKMGYALAEAVVERGAHVALVSGPVALDPPAGVKMVAVNTAEEMLAAAEEHFAKADAAIFAAAVSDFRPRRTSERKLKKGTDDQMLSQLELVENPDILATLAASRHPGQMIVGFAAETDDLESNGRRKLTSKGADMIVANPIGNGRGFGTDTNEALLITASSTEAIPLMPKRQLADVILDRMLALQSSERGPRNNC